MTGRPEILFPLFSPLTNLAGVGPKMAQNFLGLNVEKPKDLVLTLPNGVVDRRLVGSIQGMPSGQVVTIQVTVDHHNAPRSKGRPYRVVTSMDDATVELVFFHARGDYLANILPQGSQRVVSGKLEVFDGRAQIVHPDHIIPTAEVGGLPQFEPIYPLAAGVTAKVMRKAVGIM